MTESKGVRCAAEAIYKYIYSLLLDFFSWRSFIADAEMMFPTQQAKYHSPYHFRPPHHVVSKNKKNTRYIAAASQGEENESLDMHAEQSNNRNV